MVDDDDKFFIYITQEDKIRYGLFLKIDEKKSLIHREYKKNIVFIINIIYNWYTDYTTYYYKNAI